MAILNFEQISFTDRLSDAELNKRKRFMDAYKENEKIEDKVYNNLNCWEKRTFFVFMILNIGIAFASTYSLMQLDLKYNLMTTTKNMKIINFTMISVIWIILVYILFYYILQDTPWSMIVWSFKENMLEKAGFISNSELPVEVYYQYRNSVYAEEFVRQKEQCENGNASCKLLGEKYKLDTDFGNKYLTLYAQYGDEAGNIFDKKLIIIIKEKNIKENYKKETLTYSIQEGVVMIPYNNERH